MMFEIVTADLTNDAHGMALVNVLDAYARDPMGGGEPLTDYTRTHLARELNKRTDALVLLAFVDQHAVGVLTAFEGFSTFQSKPLLAIHDVAVQKAFRGKGIASALLEQAEEIARQRGYCKLTLEVLEGNRVAQSVYRQFGFSGYELDPNKGNAMFWDKKLL